MAKLYQFCKNCGEERILKEVVVKQNGVDAKVQLCTECLMLVILGSQQEMIAGLGELTTRIARRLLSDCPLDCIHRSTRIINASCRSCYKREQLKDNYKPGKELEKAEEKGSLLGK